MNTQINADRPINTFPENFKASDDFMGILKDLIIKTALNTSGYRLGILFEPFVLETEPEAKCCLVQMRVSGEALAQVHRMAKIDQMETSFNRRSVAIKQLAEGDVEVTLHEMKSDDPESLVSEEIEYLLDSGVGRLIEFAPEDIFTFLLHGTYKDEPIGEMGEA